MDFKKGGWNPSSAFDINSFSSDLLDDKMAKNIVGDLKKHLPPGGFPKHKPVITSNLSGVSPALSSNKVTSKRGVS